MSLVYTHGEEYHLKINKGDIGKYVIMPGDPGRCEKIAGYFDDPYHVITNREYNIYNGSLLGEKVTVCSTGIGGPSAAIAMEECIHCGADTFIRIGTCGGMQPEILGGDIVIATGAIRLGGTSKEYAPIEYPAVADFEVADALRKAAISKDKHYHMGVLQCKDNFYGQHDPASMPVSYELENKWDAWMKCGALASEMESDTLFIVAQIRRVRAGSVMMVVGNQTRRAMGLEDIQVHDTDAAIQVAVDAIKNLIISDREKDK